MININGELHAPQAATLSFKNRGFTYGDAVFETIRVINGKIIFWEDHYFRLMASIRILRMEIPQHFSPEFLEEEILKLIRDNQLESAAARVRFTVFRKEGGLFTPDTNSIGYVISAEALAQPFYLFNEEPYEVELFKDHYINSGLLSNLKSNNRVINVLGSIYAKENDYKNCLLLNEHKNVVEALNGNLFLVKGNEIKTPPLSEGCIKGIIRGKLIEIIRGLKDYTLVEAPVSAFELQKADEMFLTNVIFGIQPVSRYRKKEFASTVARDLSVKLNVKARLG